jgi:hypothetical protein
MDKNKKNIEKQLALVYREEPPRSRSRIISDLEQLLPIWTLSNEIGWAKQQGTTYFGTYWQGKFSDVKKLRSIAAWMISFRRSISERLLREDSIDIITNDPETHKIKVVLSQLNNSSKRFLSDFSKLKSLLQLDERIAFDRSVYAVPIQEIARRLQLWKENIFNLIAWTKSAFTWNKCMRTMAREVVVQCEQSSYCQMNDLLPCFIINYVKDLFKKIKSNKS